MIMEAKEKAADLVDKFKLYLGTDKQGNECYLDELVASWCALICVNEMYSLAQNNHIDVRVSNYLQDVENEIKKL